MHYETVLVSRNWNIVFDYDASWMGIITEFQQHDNVIPKSNLKAYTQSFFLASKFILNRFRGYGPFCGVVAKLDSEMSLLQKIAVVKECYDKHWRETSLSLECLAQNSEDEMSFKTLDCLLTIGINPNLYCQSFQSAIFSAMYVGDEKSIRRLIDAGADTTIKGKNVFDYHTPYQTLSKEKIIELKKYSTERRTN